MKARGRRLGGVMRWGVYVCTLIFLVVFIASFFYSFSGYFMRANSRPSAAAFSINNQPTATAFRIETALSSGRFELLYDNATLIRHPVRWPAGKVYSGFSSKHEKSQVYQKLVWQRTVDWWRPPKRFRDVDMRFFESGTRWNLPVAHLVVPLVVLSFWMFLRQRQFKKSLNQCSECGYSIEGLTSSICPECGVARG